MLADLYDLPLSTSSAAARDAYVLGSELALTFYPGAVQAFDQAAEADPGFALAHAGKAQVLMREGNAQGARACMAAAGALADGLSDREASHLVFFARMFAGETDAAIGVMYSHLREWPRDALVLAMAANPNGLIGGSGRIGQKRQIAELMDSLAPAYGDDWWFTAHHALALAEDCRREEARPLIQRSVAQNPNNAHAAHGYAHVCYEDGDTDAARAFLSSWLRTYPRDGFFHGHLSWHLALGELAAGNADAAYRLFQDAICPDRHSGGPAQKVSDATAFLWRAELAGRPRDPAAWRVMHDYARAMLPDPGNGLADMHVLLAQAVAGDGSGLAARVARMQEMAASGRYPSGPYLQALSKAFSAFERQDFSSAIDALEPVIGQNERIGGSRAQLDLVEFTLLRAYVNANRPGDVQRLLQSRRAGPTAVPVAGVALH
jgi:tetratricopeptide (TPR) repeat protein